MKDYFPHQPNGTVCVRREDDQIVMHHLTKRGVRQVMPLTQAGAIRLAVSLFLEAKKLAAR